MKPPAPEPPRYAVKQEEGVTHLVARGDQARVTQALLESIRLLPRALGLVLVDARSGAEWVADPVSRADALRAVMALRDLLGTGLLDAAVYCAEESLEVFLDRFGTLEIRAAAWRENALTALIEEQGFRLLGTVSTIPAEVVGEAAWSPDDRERFREVRESLGMQTPAR